MSLDPSCSLMACGNVAGQVYVWDMHTLTDKPKVVLGRAGIKVAGKAVNTNVTVSSSFCIGLKLHVPVPCIWLRCHGLHA